MESRHGFKIDFASISDGCKLHQPCKFIAKTNGFGVLLIVCLLGFKVEWLIDFRLILGCENDEKVDAKSKKMIENTDIIFYLIFGWIWGRF